MGLVADLLRCEIPVFHSPENIMGASLAAVVSGLPRVTIKTEIQI